MIIRNAYSKALDFPMTYSDKVNGNRTRVWVGSWYSEQQVKDRLDKENLKYVRIQVTTPNRKDATRHYVRVTMK